MWQTYSKLWVKHHSCHTPTSPPPLLKHKHALFQACHSPPPPPSTHTQTDHNMMSDQFQRLACSLANDHIQHVIHKVSCTHSQWLNKQCTYSIEYKICYMHINQSLYHDFDSRWNLTAPLEHFSKLLSLLLVLSKFENHFFKTKKNHRFSESILLRTPGQKSLPFVNDKRPFWQLNQIQLYWLKYHISK